MLSDLHIYGGFHLSPYLALRVFEVVGEIVERNVDRSLSHLDDDRCEVCRAAAAAGEGADDESGADRAGHPRAA
ncbi:MAG TPA: hypothetical protein VNO22_08925 [Planctomycetota bacterium]|nr:hypothetical protein [Planctomycetota bacterium]